MSISLYSILKENEEDIEKIKSILKDDEGRREIDYYKIETHLLLGRTEWYTGLTFALEKAIKENGWMEISRMIIRGSRSRKKEENGESMNDLGIQFIWSYPERFDEEFEKEMMDTDYMNSIFLLSPHLLEETSGIHDDRLIKIFSHKKYDLWINPFTIHLNIGRIVESKRKKIIEWMIQELSKGNEKELFKNKERNRSIHLKLLIEYLLHHEKYDIIELFLDIKESEYYEGNLMKELINNNKNSIDIEDLMIKIWNHSNKRMRDNESMYIYSFYGWIRLMEMVVRERDVVDLIEKGGEWKSYFDEFYEEDDERRMMKLYKERIEEKYIFLGWRDERWYRVIDYF